MTSTSPIATPGETAIPCRRSIAPSLCGAPADRRGGKLADDSASRPPSYDGDCADASEIGRGGDAPGARRRRPAHDVCVVRQTSHGDVSLDDRCVRLPLPRHGRCAIKVSVEFFLARPADCVATGVAACIDLDAAAFAAMSRSARPGLWLSVFIHRKAVLDKPRQRVDRLLGVVALGLQHQLAPWLAPSVNRSHDALGVDA